LLKRRPWGRWRLAKETGQRCKAVNGRKRPALTHWPRLEARRKGQKQGREGGKGGPGKERK